MSTMAKLFNKILLYRLWSVLERHLRDSQNGFRPNRSTTQHVLALRILMNECKHAKESPLVIMFLDFSKAFDSIRWPSMDSILRVYGVPDKLRTAIMSIYYGTSAHVRTQDVTSNPFPLTVGVLQGDTLAPYLFIIVLDYIMRRAIPDPSIGFTIAAGSARTANTSRI